jgi:hypothetical protein
MDLSLHDHPIIPPAVSLAKGEGSDVQR